MKIPRKLIVLIIFIIIICIAGLALDYLYCSSRFSAASQLIILASTLLVLIIYAWNTRRIADATEQKWEEELRPKLSYEMIMGQNDKNKVVFRLLNPTDYLIEAKINCNFKIYGQPVTFTGAYDGSELWVVFPHQISQGHFEINTILSKKGKTLQQMIQERTNVNEHEQMTMDLEISFESETGRKRKYPPRRHYFSFDKSLWVPEITRKDIMA
jgi:hypothetical protein